MFKELVPWILPLKKERKKKEGYLHEFWLVNNILHLNPVLLASASSSCTNSSFRFYTVQLTCHYSFIHLEHTHILTHTHMHTHTLTLTHTHAHSHIHTHTHSHTHAHTLSHMHTLTHMHTHTHTHSHTHTHTHIHTHTHTHTEQNWFPTTQCIWTGNLCQVKNK